MTRKKNLYIFLEHVFTTSFYDIYKNKIENKSLSELDYRRVISEVLDSNDIKFIFLLDIENQIDYYFDLSNDFLKSDFITQIVLIVYGR